MSSSPSIPNLPKQKIGFIQSYEILLPPDSPLTYFICKVTDDVAGTQNEESWLLQKNCLSKTFDVDSNGDTWVVSFSNVVQAAIASAKDAMLNGAKVTLEGCFMPNRKDFSLSRITVHRK